MFSFFNKTMSNNTETFFDLNVHSISGDELNLSKLKGKTILLVNVASNCGFKIGRAHVRTPVTSLSRMPSSA